MKKTMTKTTQKNLINHFGSKTNLANTFKVTRQAVNGWFIRGIPVQRALEIEKKTNNVITRDVLRPDIFK